MGDICVDVRTCEYGVPLWVVWRERDSLLGRRRCEKVNRDKRQYDQDNDLDVCPDLVLCL